MPPLSAEAAIYLATLTMFSFVVFGSAFLRHDMLLLVCIPPVFVAMIVGFIMALYAGEAFGLVPLATALAIGAPTGWSAAKYFRARNLLILIYLAWFVALLCALVAFDFPDHP